MIRPLLPKRRKRYITRCAQASGAVAVGDVIIFMPRRSLRAGRRRLAVDTRRPSRHAVFVKRLHAALTRFLPSHLVALHISTSRAYARA